MNELIQIAVKIWGYSHTETNSNEIKCTASYANNNLDVLNHDIVFFAVAGTTMNALLPILNKLLKKKICKYYEMLDTNLNATMKTGHSYDTENANQIFSPTIWLITHFRNK